MAQMSMEAMTLVGADMLVRFVSFLCMSTSCIFLGSRLSTRDVEKGVFAAISRPIHAADVMNIPVVSGLTLAVLYFAYTFLPREYVNLLLNVLFVFVFVSTMMQALLPLSARLAKSFRLDSRRLKVASIRIPWIMNVPLNLNAIDATNALVCIGTSIYYLISKNWILNNVLAFSIAIVAMTTISFISYAIGSALLFVMLFYDVFWVFCSDAMITIARSIDIPAKFLFPRSIFQSIPYQFSLLGLGDVLVPGLFISLLSKYDAHRSKILRKNSTVYFSVTLFAYSIGLALSMISQHIYNHPQPALLYINPACLLSSFITSLFLKDTKNLLSFKINSNS